MIQNVARSDFSTIEGEMKVKPTLVSLRTMMMEFKLFSM